MTEEIKGTRYANGSQKGAYLKRKIPVLNEEQIKHMRDRFLGWKLPEGFNPDGGISFEPMMNVHTAHPSRREPSGTNVFNAEQAEAMIRFMIEGICA